MGAKMTIQTHMLGDKRVGHFVNGKTLDSTGSAKTVTKSVTYTE